MAETAEVYLARRLGWVRRTPDEPEPGFVPLAWLDDEFVQIALARVNELDSFSAAELAFFDDGRELERLLLMEYERDLADAGVRPPASDFRA
jgi:hypothetical protein